MSRAKAFKLHIHRVQRVILAGLAGKTEIDGSSAREVFGAAPNMDKRRALERTLEVLTSCAA